MIEEAQNTLTRLTKITSVSEFNDTLLYLFTVIPRRMSYVSSYLAATQNDFGEIIQHEQDTLDVMRGQVVQKAAEETQDETPKEDVTILEKLGLLFEECDENDIRLIKDHLRSCSPKYSRAWKVTNLKTQKRFDEFVEKEHITNKKLLWHGSRNENWWSIVNSGLVLKPTNAVITAKMFAYGIYYAPKAAKSLGYTSLTGSRWASGRENCAYMAPMDVAYGRPYDVYSHQSRYYNFNYEMLQQACPGANCLHAHAGSMLYNDEIVVYKEDQSTIKYLVELHA